MSSFRVVALAKCQKGHFISPILRVSILVRDKRYWNERLIDIGSFIFSPFIEKLIQGWINSSLRLPAASRDISINPIQVTSVQFIISCRAS